MIVCPEQTKLFRVCPHGQIPVTARADYLSPFEAVFDCFVELPGTILNKGQNLYIMPRADGSLVCRSKITARRKKICQDETRKNSMAAKASKPILQRSPGDVLSAPRS